MIRDDKSPGPLTFLVNRYVEWKFRGAFRGLWVRGAVPSSEGGLIAYFNHSSFWDGFVLHQLAAAVRWNAFALMEEDNLTRYRFHTRLGAFSVRRGDAGSARESLRYAKEVLARPSAALCIFPEGELRAGQGPLAPFKRGLELLARGAQVRCVPIALRYVFLEHEHPDVLLEVGAPHEAAPLLAFEQRLATVYARVLEARSTDGFQRLVAGRPGARERWDTVRRWFGRPLTRDTQLERPSSRE